MVLDKASEYQEHAAHCLALAAVATNPEYRDMLVRMAATWETLAKDRELRLERGEPISDLEAGSDTAARE